MLKLLLIHFVGWQALWTQARENLKVLTIICANNTYAILKVNFTRHAGQGESRLSTQSLCHMPC